MLAFEHHHEERDREAEFNSGMGMEEHIPEPFVPHPVPAAALLKWTTPE